MRTKHVVAAALAVLLLTGCSATAPSETAGGELPAVDIGPYADVTAQLDYDLATAVLPMDQYALSAPDYSMRVLHAISAKTDSCMVVAGFSPVANTLNWEAPPRGEDRRYGVWSVALAEQYGLDRAPFSAPPKADILSLGVEFNKQYATCSEEAKAGLSSSIEFSQQPNIDYRIRDAAQSAALAHEDGVRAVQDWHECMESEGIVLDPATGYPSQEYVRQGKEAEIRSTVIEAGCARSTGAVQTLYDLQARFESAYIDQQGAALQEFAQRRAEALAAFDAAISTR